MRYNYNLTLVLSFNQISSISLYGAQAFAKLTPSNSYYYVVDYSLNQIFIFHDYWSYVSSKSYVSPAYLTTIGSSLYATGEVNIWKLDQNLNILIQYNHTGTAPKYRGINFNCTDNLINVAPFALNVIHVFNLKFK